jgi:beta-glucosidase
MPSPAQTGRPSRATSWQRRVRSGHDRARRPVPPGWRDHRAGAGSLLAVAVVGVLVAGLVVEWPGASSGASAFDDTAQPGAHATSGHGGDAVAELPTPPVPVSACPWLQRAMATGASPATLARDAVDRMTLAEKLGELVLRAVGPYENVDNGVSRLCIPSLSLQDGPAGLAYHDTGVTALPAPLGVAASFDPSLARDYGTVLGSEARAQGLDAVQGPNLNLDRVVWNGRAFEGFGEDPTLVSALGVAEIDGIQATGTMADAKHLVAYNQETNRGALDAVVPTRALHELYLAPFKAAVTKAHVASIMCAYPRLDGTYQCEDPALHQQLSNWGFTGFVRSDLGAVHDPAAALAAGTDLLKPGSVPALTAAVRHGLVTMATIDADVERVLTALFAHHLVGQPVSGTPGTPVDTPANAAFALRAAERSAVLLRDQGSVLPLSPATVRSIAVIGAAASSVPVAEGFGSAHVRAPFVSTPLVAIRAAAGRDVRVTAASGGSTTRPLPDVPTADLTPASGAGHGLTLTVSHAASPGAASFEAVTSTARAVLVPQPSLATPPPKIPHPRTGVGSPVNPAPEGSGREPTGQGPVGPSLPNHRDPGSAYGSMAGGGTRIELPTGWGPAAVTWTGTLTVPSSGLYSLSLTGSGAATLTLDGAPAVSDPENHVHGIWAQPVDLVAGHRYQLALHWTPLGRGVGTVSALQLGMAYDSASIAQAVAAARRSQVAVVFAGDFNAEAFDRPSLSLPGDENALITAVAAANPRTVVVLDTGGPVLMPWLSSVSAVVEAWYPGQADGQAIAAVLFGTVDPSGHLPVTFPTSMAATGIASASQWPGVGLTSTYTEGLDVGYRYDHATGTVPLFPFGFGLSYTTFSLSGLSGTWTGTGERLTVTVTDTGTRRGTAVPQVYVTDPAAAGEPPAELAAFTTVTLDPGQHRTVTLDVPAGALRTYQDGGWTTVPGTYTFGVGQSSASQPLTVTTSLP